MQKETLAMGLGSVELKNTDVKGSSQVWGPGAGAGSGCCVACGGCAWGAINCHLPQINDRSKLRTNQLATGPNCGTEKSEMILALALTIWLQKQKTIIKSPTSSLPLITFPIITVSFWNRPSYIPGHTDRGSHIADHSALLAHRKHQKKPTTPPTPFAFATAQGCVGYIEWIQPSWIPKHSQSTWTSAFYLQYMRIVGKMGLPTTPS